jgi:hypothetical protein
MTDKQEQFRQKIEEYNKGTTEWLMEEYENATAENQVRYDYEYGADSDEVAYGLITERNDVSKVLEIKAGNPKPEQKRRGKIDTRAFLELYDTPAGWFFCRLEHNLTRTHLYSSKPRASLIVEYAHYYIDEAINEEGCSFDESYEIVSYRDNEFQYEIIKELCEWRILFEGDEND